MSELQRKQEAAQAAGIRRDNIVVYKQWIAQRPEIRDCEATRRSVDEFCDLSHMPMTVADFDFALSNGMQVVKQYVPTVADENARRKALSVDELRQLARQESPQPTAPQLPLQWTPPGRNQAVDISTREALMQLAKTDYQAFKQLSEHFGGALVNERLGYKSPWQVGTRIRMEI